jgi:hypothetical protein
VTRDNTLLLVVAGSVVDSDGELQATRGQYVASCYHEHKQAR